MMQLRKKINLLLLLIIFSVFPVNGMDTSYLFNFFSNSSVFPKFQETINDRYAAVKFIAYIGTPIALFLWYLKYKYNAEKKTDTTVVKEPVKEHEEPEKEHEEPVKEQFWLEASDCCIYDIPLQEAQQNEVLLFYIKNFEHANSKTSPLKIGNKELLCSLNWEKISHIKREERLQYGLEIAENLGNKDVLACICKQLSILENKHDLNFVMDQIINLNYMHVDKSNNGTEKTFTHNKKFYYKAISTDGCSLHNKIVFCDNEDQEVFSFKNEDIIFKLAHYHNFIIFIYDKSYLEDKNNKTSRKLWIYDLEKRTSIKLCESRLKNPGRCSTFAISPNDQYVAFLKKLYGNDRIYIFDRKSGEISKLNHSNVTDFVFSFDSKNLISYGTDKKHDNAAFLWNIENIKAIKQTKLYDSWCWLIVFNSDSQFVCCVKDKYPFSYTIMNINNPQEVKELTTGCISSCAENNNYIFTNKTDFILCQHKDCPYEKIYKRTYDIFSKRGDLIYTYKPHIIYNDDEWKQPDLDWHSLSTAFQVKVDTLSKIKETITLPQMILLQNICAQERKAGEFCVLNNNMGEGKIFDSFGDNKDFLKNNLLLIADNKDQ